MDFLKPFSYILKPVIEDSSNINKNSYYHTYFIVVKTFSACGYDGLLHESREELYIVY